MLMSSRRSKCAWKARRLLRWLQRLLRPQKEDGRSTERKSVDAALKPALKNPKRRTLVRSVRLKSPPAARNLLAAKKVPSPGRSRAAKPNKGERSQLVRGFPVRAVIGRSAQNHGRGPIPWPYWSRNGQLLRKGIDLH